MIKNVWVLAVVLLCIETTILYVASHPKTKRYFDIIPSIFWIYFLPMLASTCGVLDPKSRLYDLVTSSLLPMSLFILLVTVDIKAIFRLGHKALLMFFAGGLGIGLGMVAAFVIFKPWIGGEYWSGFGALAGSWTGGSANMIAVKEALGTPESVFSPMVIVDTVVPYVWMGFLVIVAHHQHRFDRWNRSDRSVLDEIGRKMSAQASKPRRMSIGPTVGILALAIAGGFLAKALSVFLPTVKDVITRSAWTIILVSILGILLSLTPLRKIEAYGATKVGYFLLYFVLTAIGAKASIHNLGNALVLIGAGFLTIGVHAVILLLAARIFRAPLFLAAVASQANVGGVASAPMVAEIYQKGFASVGLLLAILGNMVGTYVGIAIGQICRVLQ